MSKSPMSENTIAQQLAEDSEFFSDSELNQVQSSSSSEVSESEVDDSDADPTYDPIPSTSTSFLSNQTINRSVLSSSEEDDLPDGVHATSRPTAHRRPGRFRRSHDSSGSESEHESDGWEDVLEGEDPGFNHAFEFNETPGCKHCPPKNSPPITYFDLFFTMTFLNIIVTYTNMYARNFIRQNIHKFGNSSRHRVWKPVSFVEIKAFLAVIINMGLNKKPTIEMYWNTKSSQHIPWFGKMFARNRFESILKFFHMVDTTNLPKPKEPGYDPCARFNPIVDHANYVFRRYYTPNKQLSIDESLVGTKNHSQLLQYMPNKHHHKWGVKLWLLCDSVTHYCLSFFCYKGKRFEEQNNDNENKGLGFTVVMKLLQMGNYLNKGFHIFVDNFFTSIPLAKALYLKLTYLTGTLRSNRKGIPPSMKEKFHVGQTKNCRKRFMLMVGSRLKKSQKKQVLLLSTNSEAKSELKSKKRGNKLFITSKPSVIRQYNSYMGGVDTSDQMLYCYLDERRTLKYWKKVTFHIFGRMMTNLYILYKNNTDKPLSRLNFTVALVEGLAAEWLGDQAPERMQRPGSSGDPLDILPERKERNCSVCSKISTSAGGKRKKTRYICKLCNKGVHPLCLPKHVC